MKDKTQTQLNIKIIAVLAMVCIIVTGVIFMLFINILKNRAIENFTDSVHEILFYAEKTVSDRNMADLETAYALKKATDVSFSIMDSDGNSLLNNEEAFIYTDESGEPAGLVPAYCGLSDEMIRLIKSRLSAQNPPEYSYEVLAVNALQKNSLLFFPESIVINKVYPDETAECELVIPLSGQTAEPSSEDSSGRLFLFDEAAGRVYGDADYLTDDISVFEYSRENYLNGRADSAEAVTFYGIGNSSCAMENRSIFTKIIACARPLPYKSNDSSETYWAVFGQKINLWDIYGGEFLGIAFFFVVLFIISGLIIIFESQKRNKLKEKNEAAVNLMRNSLAHDIKTPISAISGYSDLLSEVSGREDKEVYLKRIKENIERISAYVDEMSSISKLTSPDYKPDLTENSVKDLTFEALSHFEAYENHNLVRIEGEDFTVNCDRKQFTRVLENLISNALKNVSPGGSIIISISGGRWRIFNTGLPIEASDLRKIWEPYYTTDKSRTGSIGMGLFIAKVILDAHGFEYRAENTVGGVEFTLFLNNTRRP